MRVTDLKNISHPIGWKTGIFPNKKKKKEKNVDFVAKMLKLTK